MEHRDDNYTLSQALDESIVIWRKLAVTGSNSKEWIIRRLYEQGKLSRECYRCHCPLCYYTNMNCTNCPWPGFDSRFPKLSHYQCGSNGSPYREWLRARSKKENKITASLVLRLLKRLRKEHDNARF